MVFSFQGQQSVTWGHPYPFGKDCSSTARLIRTKAEWLEVHGQTPFTNIPGFTPLRPLVLRDMFFLSSNPVEGKKHGAKKHSTHYRRSGQLTLSFSNLAVARNIPRHSAHLWPSDHPWCSGINADGFGGWFTRKRSSPARLPTPVWSLVLWKPCLDLIQNMLKWLKWTTEPWWIERMYIFMLQEPLHSLIEEFLGLPVLTRSCSWWTPWRLLPQHILMFLRKSWKVQPVGWSSTGSVSCCMAWPFNLEPQRKRSSLTFWFCHASQQSNCCKTWCRPL